ncbi:MAG: hypothetical protein HN576_05125 [Bacteriovoracaceae bacterium]|nr:hypothetical protein [Bacteriovoracaceae bacterium]
MGACGNSIEIGVDDTALPGESTSLNLTTSFSELKIFVESSAISISGGTSPYTLTFTSCTGTTNNASLKVTPSSTGNCTVKATDLVGVTGDITFQVYKEKSGTISADETWSDYIKIIDDISIDNNVTITIAAGTNVTFNKFGGGAIIFNIGINNNDNSLLDVNGSSSDHVSFSSVSGTVGSFNTPFYTTGADFQYTDFSSIGSATVDSFFGRPNTGDSFIFNYCTFDSSGRILLQLYNSSLLEIKNSSITDSLSSESIQIAGGGNASVLDNNYIDGKVSITASNFTVQNNTIVGNEAFIHLFDSDNSLIKDNIIYNTSTSTSTHSYYNDRSDNVTLSGNFIKGGDRVLEHVNTINGGTISNNIIEATNDVGFDCNMYNIPDGGIVSNNIFLGSPVLSAIWAKDITKSNISIKNNTFNFAAKPSAGNIFLDITTASYFSSIRNNLFLNGGIGIKQNFLGADVITSVDYNGHYLNSDNYLNIDITAKVEKANTDFAINDLGGAIDSQVDPLLFDVSRTSTSYSPTQLASEAITLSEVLISVRTDLRPISSSPARDAGDPADNGDSDVLDGTRDIGALEY